MIPSHAALRVVLAQVFRRLVSRWPVALWYLDRCLAAEAGDWRLWADRAEANHQLGDLRAYEADLNKAVKLSAAADAADPSRCTASSACAAYACARWPTPARSPASRRPVGEEVSAR